ncbi:MAG: hypothetical protein WCQ70_12105 [Lentimicrobiaceae bacterium]
MKETELALKFIDYFNDGYEVYKEVPCDGIVDFVAKQGKTTICVEVKLSLNFEVIGQAYGHLKYCSYSYIAIPEVNRRHFGFQICEMLGIGVLMCSNGGVQEVIKPKLNRRPLKWLYTNLKDYMKESVAGSQHDRITVFGNTVYEIKQYVKHHQGCTLADCLKNIEYHWNSFSGAKRSVYDYIQTGVIKDIRIDNDKLYTNP